MVFGFGVGQRRRIPEADPCASVRAEVKFWKTELDRCVAEKQQWIERCANTARQNEVLRTEVYLLQQDINRLQDVFAMGPPASPKAPAASPLERDRENLAAMLHHTPTVVAAHAMRSSARTPHTPAREPEDEDYVDFTPAAQRFLSPCSNGTIKAQQSSKDEVARWRDETNSLRKYLQEARALNDSLKQQVVQQQHRAEFLRSTAEAYKNEAQHLQEKLLAQHGINDETADETVKLLADLGRLQQTNALLTRDLALKDSMIHLLQQQLAELSNQMLPATPRIGRSPERTTFSTSACSTSPDGHTSPRLHDQSPERSVCADAAAAGDMKTFNSSLSGSTRPFHHGLQAAESRPFQQSSLMSDFRDFQHSTAASEPQTLHSSLLSDDVRPPQATSRSNDSRPYQQATLSSEPRHPSPPSQPVETRAYQQGLMSSETRQPPRPQSVETRTYPQATLSSEARQPPRPLSVETMAYPQATLSSETRQPPRPLSVETRTYPQATLSSGSRQPPSSLSVDTRAYQQSMLTSEPISLQQSLISEVRPFQQGTLPSEPRPLHSSALLHQESSFAVHANLEPSEDSYSLRSASIAASSPTRPAASRGTLDGTESPDSGELELAGLVAVHAAMYKLEKENLKQGQQQLEAALAAAKYEVAATEASWGQVLDGLTSERLKTVTAKWTPPKPRPRSWREEEGKPLDMASILQNCSTAPCSCSDTYDEPPRFGALAAPSGMAKQAGAAATKASGSGGAGPRIPPRGQGRRAPKVKPR